MPENPLAADLDHILEHTRDLWDDLRGQRIFITGGTGFFGCWLLESLAWANDHLNLDVQAVVLTRDPINFQKKAPHLASNRAIQLLRGNLGPFRLSERPLFAIIHAAVEHFTNPVDTLNSMFQGTRKTLELARRAKARRYLLTSSGAVYGRQPSEIHHMPESFTGAPDPLNPGTAYAHGKRISEFLCAYYANQFGVEPVIARCYTFIGPYLPLDANYAIGNFIRDAQKERPIQINGDGTPYRSYLYAADLAIWLWTILLRGKPCDPYNVGSENDLSIYQLASTVVKMLNQGLQINVAKESTPGSKPERYVPSTMKARKDLNLKEWIPLREAIQLTAKWNHSLTQTNRWDRPL